MYTYNLKTRHSHKKQQNLIIIFCNIKKKVFTESFAQNKNHYLPPKKQQYSF